MNVLITGANRGIGLEMARLYVEAGHKVTATTRGDVPAGLSEKVNWHRLDVTKPESFGALNTTLDGQAIDLLICNAGVYLDKGQTLADGFAADLWAKTFAANVTGVFLTVQNLLPNLQSSKAARVAIVASRMGSNASANGGAYVYRASKAAVINLASNLACDLSHLDIAVGAYHPGWVRTDMGGASADIDVATSAAGLVERFAALSPATTGCFESYDGTTLAY